VIPHTRFSFRSFNGDACTRPVAARADRRIVLESIVGVDQIFAEIEIRKC
jgi:hypothetical protein